MDPAPQAATTRVVVVQSTAQWTGQVEKQDFLSVPASIDMAREEQAWFAAGGDASGNSFAEYLISRGAIRLSPEIWTINYL